MAFIDSDAYADPDWLYYLVSALDEHEAAAVGGPNLSLRRIRSFVKTAEIDPQKSNVNGKEIVPKFPALILTFMLTCGL